MRHPLSVFVSLIVLLPVIALSADVSLTQNGQVPGAPFQALQQQIDALNVKLNAQQQQIEGTNAKLNMLFNQACPEGQFVVGISATGSILCESLPQPPQPPQPTVQKWIPGWDEFDVQLDYEKSTVSWSQPPATSDLRITFNLLGAPSNHLYQVGVHMFDRCDPAFGQFPSTSCDLITRQGATRLTMAFELGVVLTDSNGSGSLTVVVKDIVPQTYVLEFTVRAGVGCNGTTGGSACDVIFQSPGPFGVTTAIVVP